MTLQDTRNDLRPILLCGMMGSGKSTIARTLSRQTGRPWRDLDRAIEARAGNTIPELFAQQGEEVFRKLERDELFVQLQIPNLILALGGGALQDQEVVDRVKKAGWLIFLDAPQSVLLRRLGRKTGRPLTDSLSRDELRKKLHDLLAQREGFYRQAHFTLPVGDHSPNTIASRIQTEIQDARP